jgi:hypothetical protein
MGIAGRRAVCIEPFIRIDLVRESPNVATMVSRISHIRLNKLLPRSALRRNFGCAPDILRDLDVSCCGPASLTVLCSNVKPLGGTDHRFVEKVDLITIS